jgi:hypothetical protein
VLECTGRDDQRQGRPPTSPRAPSASSSAPRARRTSTPRSSSASTTRATTRRKHFIVSATPPARRTASPRSRRCCTRRFGIVQGLMTTVHSYTMDQNLLDSPHRKGPAPRPRRGDEHGPVDHGRREGDRPRAAGAQGQARRHLDARADAERLDHVTSSPGGQQATPPSPRSTPRSRPPRTARSRASWRLREGAARLVATSSATPQLDRRRRAHAVVRAGRMVKVRAGTTTSGASRTACSISPTHKAASAEK